MHDFIEDYPEYIQKLINIYNFLLQEDVFDYEDNEIGQNLRVLHNYFNTPPYDDELEYMKNVTEDLGEYKLKPYLNEYLLQYYNHYKFYEYDEKQKGKRKGWRRRGYDKYKAPGQYPRHFALVNDIYSNADLGVDIIKQIIQREKYNVDDDY